MVIEIGPILQDFTIIMVVASVMAMISYKLKQPMVIGYIIAGMIIGEWYKTRWTVKHDDTNKEIHEVAEIEYPIGTGWRKVLDKVCKDTPDQFFNK